MLEAKFLDTYSNNNSEELKSLVETIWYVFVTEFI